MIANNSSPPTHESLVKRHCKPYWGKYRGTVINNIDPKSAQTNLALSPFGRVGILELPVK